MNNVPMQLPFPPKQWWKVVVGWDENTHKGYAKYCWDFVLASGSSKDAQLCAAAAGPVAQIDPGGWLYVKHGPGEYFVYLHIMPKSTGNLVVGDQVQMAQNVAHAGDTGTTPGNYHLHAALSNTYDGTDPKFTTIESEFIDYDVSKDQGATFTHVAKGIPKTGEWVRRASLWSAWVPRDQGIIKGSPSAKSRKPTITDVFARGMDDRLWQDYYVSGQGWSGWRRHEDGFVLGSSPVVDSMNPDHLQIFACDPSGKVFQKWWTAAAGWSAWTPRDQGTIKGSATAVSRKPSITDVFARGTDDRLWQDYYVSGQGWSGWRRHEDGFVLGSSPAVDSMNPDHVQIFACDPSGKIFQKWWTATGGWSAWTPRDQGTIKGSATAVSRKPTITDMFARGTDDRLWQDYYVSGQGWSGWRRHEDGFVLGSSPAVDSMNPDHVQIFACDPSGRVFHKWWTSQ